MIDFSVAKWYNESMNSYHSPERFNGQINGPKSWNEQKIQELKAELENDAMSDEDYDEKMAELYGRIRGDKYPSDYSSAGEWLEEPEEREESEEKEALSSLGEVAVKAVEAVDIADVIYESNIASLRLSEVYAFSEEHLDLQRKRTNYETKQDVILAVRIIFDHFSKVGSNLGQKSVEPRKATPKVGKRTVYHSAEAFMLNFLNNVGKYADPTVYRDEYGKFRPIRDTIRNSLEMENVNWFGPDYQETEFSTRHYKAFRKHMEKAFKTKELYDPDYPKAHRVNAAKRRNYIRELSGVVAKERRKYKKNKKALVNKAE